MEWGQVFPLAPAALKTGWLTALFGGMLVLWVGLFFFITHMIQQAVAKSCFRLFSPADDDDEHNPAASSCDHHDDG